ncbi:MAG: bifunctional 2-polyprenyl-6-hydroxyphenol methylase/3-demethylubiquinol 3-O-methyltransferase UbiG [Thermodesulfobacteriota bacterium]
MADKTQIFDTLESDWWNPEGSLKSLHEINPLRFSYVRDNVDSLEGRKVLDVGCGGGLLAEEFAKEGALVTGIDIAPTALDAAKAHAEKSGLKVDYRLTLPCDMIEEGGSYDILACMEVFEHVDNVGAFVKDCSRLLKDGGHLFFSTLNKTLRAKLLAVFVAENILNIIPKGAHDYEKFIKPSTLTYILKENSIAVQELKGITFDFWSMGFRISDDLSVNYLGYGVKG